VPLGRYELKPEEGPQIQAHARRFENIHPTLEVASLRLVDGSRQTKSRDAIVDAVIGLESILLYGTDRRGLGFRFSLNYATLFPKDAYHTARDLYNLRSTISHGTTPKGAVRIGDKEITIHEAALARSVLRKTIGEFMPHADNPDFLVKEYWIRKALALEESAVTKPWWAE
jgi:hypothetical protein